MRICPICTARDYPGGICAICGFDESLAWERYATLVPLPGPAQSLAGLHQAYLARQALSPAAQDRMARQLFDAAKAAEDIVEKIQLYKRSALLGFAPAQRAIGKCYYYGIQLGQNSMAAVEWFWKAAEQDDPEAQYYLGLCYRHGQGVHQDMAQAIRWFARSAEQENPDAQFALAQAASQKDADLSVQSPIYWYQKAAGHGHAKAQLALGDHYLSGIGTARDPAEALKWYRSAAKQGQSAGLYHLAMCYREGASVPQDDTFAAQLLREAAGYGSEEAREALLRFYGA